jgi:hydroxymethylpyrimidine pyrophosphatase-like HAD family hydrolase
VVPNTYEWARRLDVAGIAAAFDGLEDGPLLVIGSGGSLSTASLAADLWNASTGNLGRFDTPYLAASAIRNGFSGNVLVVSAGGENRDVIGIARLAIETEVRALVSLCCRTNSTLTRLVRKYGRGIAWEFDCPAGSDGFLATNSLVALNTIVSRGFGKETELPRSWPRMVKTRSLYRMFTADPLPEEIILLHGADTRSSAVDLESKFSEAALAAIQLVDLRNFGHGRHNWLAKRPRTGIIALVSRRDADLIGRTIHALPKSIRSLVLQSRHDGLTAAFETQSAVFDLTLLFGKEKGIDPGRPGVPPFGRSIYHLNAFSRLPTQSDAIAIARKKAARASAGFGQLRDWNRHYETAVNVLGEHRFKQIILDYDGTLCDHRDRLNGLREDIARELERLLGAGIPIGVATGRGRSVRSALRDRIPTDLWRQMIIGYYNSTICLPLSADEELTQSVLESPAIRRAYDCLRKADLPPVELTLRPTQLTVEAVGKDRNIKRLWQLVVEQLEDARLPDLKIVSSSRSIDILCATASKLQLIDCMSQRYMMEETLFIGDRPRWPGNDYEILKQRFALSVDEVGPSLTTGWNLAPAGVLNADACLYYLRACRTLKSGFKLLIGLPR